MTDLSVRSLTHDAPARTRLRFVTAASLFDGHDASINIMRRILQASGAEVIHLGHNRSVDEVVTAALQEDVQGIAESAAEVDMALVLGLGFPRHAGGPLKYADWLGLKHVVARCDAYASLGPLYKPTEGMRAAALAGRKLY